MEFDVGVVCAACVAFGMAKRGRVALRKAVLRVVAGAVWLHSVFGSC